MYVYAVLDGGGCTVAKLVIITRVIKSTAVRRADQPTRTGLLIKLGWRG